MDSLNGNDDNKYNLSIIDLGKCEKLLKEENDIDEEIQLIVFKFEKLTSQASEKNVQYEIYAPNTTQKLDLSICQSTSIDLYIPIALSEETQSLYSQLSNQGYDLFNENDSFYQDVCATYTSENGTDVLLSDRQSDFYDTSENTCQANCQYSAYLSDSQYLKCECDVVNDNIDTQEPEKFTGEVIITSFYNVLKYSNLGVLKCYKLVFDLSVLTNNYGSIIVMVYFLPYFICLLVFIFKEITPLKIDVSKLLLKMPLSGQNNGQHFNNSIIHNKNKVTNDNRNSNLEKNKNKETKQNNIKLKNNKNENKNKNEINKNKKSNKSNNKSNKSTKSNKSNNKDIDNKDNKNHQKKNDTKNKKTKFKKLASPPTKRKNGQKYTGKESEGIKLYQRKKNKNKSQKTFNSKLDNVSITIHKTQSLNSKRRFVETRNNDELNYFKKMNVEKKTNNKKEKKGNMNKKEEEKLSDFELNDLEYLEAIELDKRQFGQIYWATLKREHIILFTFFSWNDYNIIYVKIARFIFLIVTDMAMNVIFFTDDSMHKLYLNYGEYDFVQQIPQIIYSTAISQLLEVFLCFLSLTDKYFYEIKSIKNDKHRNDIIFRIFRCIKIKLIIFFVFTFILFAFYWYFVSAFCAVYQNTQTTYIKDSVSSYLTGLLYPLALYLIPSSLRMLSFFDSKKKRLKIIYKLSDIIPFF